MVVCHNAYINGCSPFWGATTAEQPDTLYICINVNCVALFEQLCDLFKNPAWTAI